MAKSKAQQNALMLDPQRQMIAKNMSVIPGGPENNNPMNVTDIATPPVKGASIYGDYAQQYPQMGTGMVNPMAVGPSGLQQNFPAGRGQNSMAPYGLQQQPDTSANAPVTDMMESNRIAGEVSQCVDCHLMQWALLVWDQSLEQWTLQMSGSGPMLMQGNPSAEMIPWLYAPKNWSKEKRR